MTVTMATPSGIVGSAEDRIVVVCDPRPGTIVELEPGSQLGIRFRRGLGESRWHIADQPGHLLPLTQGGHEFQFLVFGTGEGPQTLRLERRHPDREFVHEVCEVLVVPVSDAGGQTSRPASRRTA
jgi:hypothetical protein